jgi:hypothetical protein
LVQKRPIAKREVKAMPQIFVAKQQIFVRKQRTGQCDQIGRLFANWVIWVLVDGDFLEK